MNALALIAELRESFRALIEQAKCTYQAQVNSINELKRIKLNQDFRYGVVPDNDPFLKPRSLARLPLVREDRTSTEVTLDLSELNQKMLIISGHYANLGDDPFQVILHDRAGQVTAAHTLPAGVSIQIRSAIAKITIRPVDGNEAFYQVYGL